MNAIDGRVNEQTIPVSLGLAQGTRGCWEHAKPLVAVRPGKHWFGFSRIALLSACLGLPALACFGGSPPVITAQPTNQIALPGGSVTFSVGVSGTGPFRYQWQVNETNLPNTITTVAGGGVGDGQPATNALVGRPYGVAVDRLGNLVISDFSNNRIRKVETNGIITTVAGNGTYGYSGDGGAAINASLGEPTIGPAGIAADTLGNIFIADTYNNRIRKVDVNGIITTVAGNGTGGYSGDGGAATNASLSYPYGVGVDAFGNIFIADTSNNCIRKVDANGIITTVAGNGSWGYYGAGDGGAATNASLASPYGVVVDAFGNLFIADSWNYCIRSVDTNGIISTVAGNGTGAYVGDGGAATNASFSNPLGIAVDSLGNLFIADTYNNCIRKVDTNGIITTVAGGGEYLGDGGAATSARLPQPRGIAFDTFGNLFIASYGDNRIRKVGTNGIITTVAGNGTVQGYYGDGGAATSADLSSPCGVGVDTFGNLFIADTQNARVRKVGTNGIITRVAGGDSQAYSGDGGAATNGSLAYPSGIGVDAFGNLYIADSGNNRIRKVETNGIITTVVGNGARGYSGDGGAATSACLTGPSSVAADSSGNLFIADTGNYCIRKVGTNGIITTVAGNVTNGYSGDGSAAIYASLSNPEGIAVDTFGNLFIADVWNHRIRKVDTNGIITTVAGNGTRGYSGDGGAAKSASLNSPFGVGVDAFGNLFIADTDNSRIRKVDTNSIITTVAGNSPGGYSGDGGAAIDASLSVPYGVSFDAFGNLFIADTYNNRIRKVSNTQGPILALNNISRDNAGNYQVVVTGPGGSVTSAVTVLTVLIPPLITLQPSSQTIVAGAGVSFTVAATGTAPLTYQWQFNGDNLAGQTNTSLLLTNVLASQAGSYGVLVTNAFGSVTSAVAVLAVLVPPFLTLQPTNQAVLQGNTASFSVAAGGTTPLSYQWFWNGTNLLAGATNSVLSLTNVQPVMMGGYYAVITNLVGSVTSQVAILTVHQVPSITSQPVSQIAAGGTNVTLTVVASGSGPLTYQWRLNGTPMPNIIITVAGNGSQGSSGDGGQATNAALDYPFLVAVDPAGNIFIGDVNYNNVRKVTTGGIITTVVSNHCGWMSADAGGNVFISGSDMVYKLATNGMLTIVAGGGTSGDGGQATNAGLSVVGGVAVDRSGDLFLLDGGAGVRLRKVGTDGIISTVASGLGGNVRGLAVDTYGNLYFADLACQCIRKFGTNGLLSTAAGGNGATYAGDGGPATNASLNYPYHMAFDSLGNMFITDSENYRLRKVDPNGIITTVAGNGVFAFAGDGGPATSASLKWDYTVAVDSFDNLFISDTSDTRRIRKVLMRQGPAMQLKGVSLADSGAYDVVVSNAFGSITSLVANLTVQLPLTMTTQPQNQTAPAGTAATFTAAISGTSPAYQWWFNGTNVIPGATSSFLTLTNVQPANIGAYSVIVTNGVSAVTSLLATLSIPTAQLVTAVVGRGQVGVSPPTAPYYLGQNIALLAVPGQYYAFAHWSDGAWSNPHSVVLGSSNFFAATFTNTIPIDAYFVDSTNIVVPAGTPLVLVNGHYGTNFTFGAMEIISVTITSSFPNAHVYYSLDSSEPDFTSLLYSDASTPAVPLSVTQTTTVRAIAYNDDGSEFQEADPVQIVVLPVYQLTDTTLGGGSIAFNPAGGIYLSNTAVVITATASNGWTFMGWQGIVSSTNNPVTLTMNTSNTVRAVFGTSVTTNLPSGGGIVLSPPQGPYAYGSTLRLIGVPAGGKYFSRWFSAFSGPTNNPLNFVVLTNTPAINAIFANLPANNFTLTTLLNGSGTVTRSPGSSYYPSNATVQVTAMPDSSFVFGGWSGDAGGTNNPITLLLNTNKVLTATFNSTNALPVQPPAISITNPFVGAVFTAPANVAISASASTGSVALARVSFYGNSTLLGTVSNTPYNLTWTNAPIGTNILTAIVLDNSSLSATSAPVTISVLPSTPQAALVSPTNGSVFTTPANISISALASDPDNALARVELYAQATTNNSQPFLLSTITTPPYNFTWSNVVVGSYLLTAKAVDAYGPVAVSSPVGVSVAAMVTTNPAVFQFSAANYEVNENSGSVNLPVLNGGDLAGSVSFQTINGTAHAGTGFSGDYTAASGNLFLNGHQSTNLSIQILDNYLDRPDIHFQVQLLFPSPGASLGNPATATVTIHENDVGGATNSLLALALPTSQSLMNGQLTVALAPAAAGGQWRFPWDLGWRTNGQSVASLVPGDYPIEFRSLSNYLAYPPIVTVTVPNNGTAAWTNQYWPTFGPSSPSDTGSLTVNIGPNSPAGAGWRFLGESAWRSPGSKASGLLPDTYFVEFAAVANWTKPASQAVQVSGGAGLTVLENYLSPASAGGAALPVAVANNSLTDYGHYPYGFNGQLQTDVGYGSGVAVRENIVLTAAHMVFNDQTLSFVNRAWWSFQEEAGVYQPEPMVARGWFMLSGYAAQRTNDLAPVGTLGPDQSSPQSRNLDVAALYFLSPAARTGYGGYLTSDAVPNPWLTGSNLKMLVGYPVDGSFFGQVVQPGTIYVTPVQPDSRPFTLVTNQTYAASWFLSYPGNSGGPVYVSVPYSGGTYYFPAAVYLGTLYSQGSYQSVVRAIDSTVVNLINLAVSQGDTGTNNTGGGVITIMASGGSGLLAYLQVPIGPTNALAAGAAWRVYGTTNWSTAANYTAAIPSGSSVTLEFKPIPGWNLPTNSTTPIALGQLTTVPATYTAVAAPAAPVLTFNPDSGLGITGTTGTTFRLEYRTSLVSGEWLPLKTNTLAPGFNLLLPWPPTNGPAAFYRAVWLP